MLVNGGLAHVQPLGNLAEGEPVTVMQHDDLAAHRRLQVGDTLMQRADLGFDVLGFTAGNLTLQHQELSGPFIDLAVTHHIQALVAHA